MLTIRLRINENIAKHVLFFLRRFSKEEIEIIEEDAQFLEVKKYLDEELAHIESGNAEFIDINELNKELENTLKKYDA